MNSFKYVFLTASVVLLTAGLVSAVTGKTIGPYGSVETTTSPFYWIIVMSYLGLGLMCLVGAIRILRR